MVYNVCNRSGGRSHEYKRSCRIDGYFSRYFKIYEKVGVIPPVERDKNGYRIYQMKDLNWIYLVKHLRQAGVTIELLVEFCRLGQLPKDEAVQNQQKEVLTNNLKN